MATKKGDTTRPRSNAKPSTQAKNNSPGGKGPQNGPKNNNGPKNGSRNNRPGNGTASTKLGAQAQKGKDYLTASYGTGEEATPAMGAVMDYYNSLPIKQQRAAYRDIAAKVEGRDLTQWSGDPGTAVLHGDLPIEARAAYSMAGGFAERQAAGANSGFPDPAINGVTGFESILPSGSGFSTGVSGATLEFTKEAGQGPPGEEAEGGATKDNTKKNRRKAQDKKLVSRASKKSGVPRKDIRKALRTEGTTKKEEKLYKEVGQESGNKKLSDRLRQRDKSNDKKSGGNKKK